MSAMQSVCRWVGVLLLVIHAAESGANQPFEVAARVVHVDDGDTVVMLVNEREQVRTRLASIDAPETGHTSKSTGRIGQPYSTHSKKFLEGMVKGRQIVATCFEQDRFGRMVCALSVEGVNVNAEMVRSGWAWANTSGNGRFLRDRSLLQAQRQAQEARAGLWAGNNPVAPWMWRRQCWEEGNCQQ